MPECLREQHFHKKVIVCFFLLCRLILIGLPVSAQTEKTTAAVNCRPLESGLPLVKLPRLISDEGTECRWFAPSPNLWPVSVLLSSMEWLVTGFQIRAGTGSQVLQPAQPDRRFSWQSLLSKRFLPEAEPTAPAREQRLEALKTALIPDDLPPWQEQTLSEQWQQLQQSLPDVETQSRETDPVRLFITIIDQNIRIALSSRKPVSSQQLISFNTALHDLLLAMYQMILEQEPMADSQPDDYSPMVSAAGGGGDDDGNSDDESGQDDKLPDIILDFALLPALLTGADSDLLTLSILEQRSRLRKLRRRLARMIASGRSTMAAILRDRIMVIEADEEDLLNLAVSPEQKGQMILPLLEKMLESLTEDTLMPAEYDYAGNLRQAPVEQADTPKNSQNTLSGQGASGTSPNNVRSQKQPGQISGRRTNDDDDDDEDQRPGQKKTVANRTPETICSVCGQLIQKNEPVVISSTDNRVYCQKHQPANILLLPEVVLRLLAEYLEWEDLIALTSTCRHFRVLGQNNPVHLYLKPLVRKMLGDKQKADLTQKAFGVEKEIEHRLRHFKIPESVIAKAIQADTTIYLQALHNYLLRYKIGKLESTYTKYPERVLCIQSLSDGNVACGLGSGEVLIMNEELGDCRVASFPIEQERSLFAYLFTFLRKKKPSVVSITELSDHRLLVGVTDHPDRFEKKNATFTRAVDKVLTSIALCDTKAETWFVFPGAVIEPGISAMEPLADHRLAFYHHSSQSLHIWSTRKGAEKELLTLAMESPVAGMVYQEAGQRLLIGHVSGMVSVWSTGQTDPVFAGKLLTPDRFSKHKPNCEVVSMKLFSDNRLAMAFPGYVLIWNAATEPIVFQTALIMENYSRAGQAGHLSSHRDLVDQPVVESWVELHDRRLAILLRLPSQYDLRLMLIFWDTSSCDVITAFDSGDDSCSGMMSEFSVYGMMPLFGQHLLLASQRGEVLLWGTIPGNETISQCSVNHEFVDFIDLETPLFELSGSRILTCFGGRYLYVLEFLCDQKDQ